MGLRTQHGKGKAGAWLLRYIEHLPHYADTMEYYTAKENKTRILFYRLPWKECQDIY